MWFSKQRNRGRSGSRFAMRRQRWVKEKRTRLGIERLEERALLTVSLSGVPNWFEQGPGPMINAQLTVPPNDPAAGAIQSIAVLSSQPSHMIVGGTGGGVWRTTNANSASPGTVTWTPVGDKLGALSIGALAYDTADASGNTFLAGTGDFSNAFDGAGRATGLYRTTDGGATWSLLGTATVGGNPLVGLQIKSILVIGNTILASGVNPFVGSRDYRLLGGALYRSPDGGSTFTQEVGVGANDLPAGAVPSLVQDPNTANTVFAAVPGQGVYRSTDAGNNWTPVNTGLGLTGTESTIELAVEDNGATTTVYAATATGGTLNGVFSTTNSGGNWTALAGALPAGFNAGSNFAEKLQLFVDPDNSGFVYMAGQGGSPGGDVYRYSGGVWTSLFGAGANGTTPHVDSHDLRFLGNDSLLYASDGGLYLLNNPHNVGANTWQSFNGSAPNGIRAVEFFAVAYDPNGDRIMGGSQDNGAEIQTALNNQSWNHVQDGDGQNQEYDAANNIRYGLGNNFGNFDRAAGGGVGTQMQLRANGNPTNFSGLVTSDTPTVGNFNGFQAHVPFILNSVDPTRILLGRNGLYESDPAAITPTGDVIRNITPAGMAQARAVAFGGVSGGVSNVNVALVGTTSGQLFFRQAAPNGNGTDFTNVSASLGGSGAVEDIALDPQEWRRVYVLRGDQIFVTNDITNLGGNPFVNVTGTLAGLSSDVRTVELYDTTPGIAGDAILLAGGLGGVFRRNSGNWSEYGNGLPNIVAQDIRFSTDDVDGNAGNGTGRMVVATMGRGAWTVDNVSSTIASTGILYITGDTDFANEDDTIRIVRNAANPTLLDVFLNNNTSTPTQQFELAAIQEIVVDGLGGNDNLIVDSTNGLITVPNGIRYDGDGGFDRLTLQQTGGGQQTSETYSVGPIVGEGSDVIVGPGGTQTVYFQGLEPTTSNVPAASTTVNATPADNAINYVQGPGGGIFGADVTGLITIDEQESYEFSQKVALVINAQAGSDEINLNNPNTPTGLTGITVNGNDPTASDTLIVNGTVGVDNVTFTPTGFDAGTVGGAGPVSITFTTTEHVEYVGRGGADVLIINGTGSDDTFTVNPTGTGSGSLRSGLSPTFDYSGATALTVNPGGGGFDVVYIDGSAAADTVTSTATTVSFTGAGSVLIGAGIDRMILSTYDSIDTITLSLGVAGLDKVVDGGSGNDVINLSGVTTDATIYGGDGDDTITGSPTADLIYGGRGNDILIGAGGDDVIYGEDGNDIFGNPSAAANGSADDGGNDKFFGGDGSDTFVWEPGDGSDLIEGGADEGDVLSFFGSAGVETFTFNAVGTRLELLRSLGSIDMDIAGVEQVNLSTAAGGDTVTINDLYDTDVQVVSLDLGGAGDTVTVNGRALPDTIGLSTPGAGAVNVRGLRYDVNIVNAATSLLTINGNEGDDVIKSEPGVGAVMPLTLIGNSGNDYLEGSASNDAMDGGAGDDVFVGNGGTDAIGGGAGSSVGDTILLPGTSGIDVFSLSMNGSGHLLATVNGVTTTYTNFIGGAISSSGIEEILTQGLAGNDTLTVDSTTAAIPIPVNFDGGDNVDVLKLTGGAATSDIYNVGPAPGSGSSTMIIGGVTQIVAFSQLEPVIDLVGGPLVVNATDADNAIDYRVGRNDANTADDGTRGLVSIDNQEFINFSGKTTLTINALAGSDEINLNNPNTPASLTAITVNGNDPTASDTVVVNGTGVGNSVTVDQFTADGARVTGAGPVVITVATAESLVYNGQGGNDTLTITGTVANDDIVYTPGATADDGLVVVNSLLPVSFLDIGSTGTLALADLGGTDRLIYNGGAGNDNFSVNVVSNGVIGYQSDVASVVGGTTHIRVTVPTAANFIEGLLLNGFDGDDNFIITASSLFTLGIAVNAGGPGGADVVTINGTGGADTYGLTLGPDSDSLTGAVGGPVVLTNVEDLVISSGAGTDSLTVNSLGSLSDLRDVAFFSGGDATDTFVANATAYADDITVTPLSATEATVSANSAGPTVYASLNAAVGSTFTVNALGGSDSVSVVGTQSGETITVNSTTVAVGALKVITYSGTENLRVLALAGNDTIDVTPSVSTTIFVDGGDPIGSTPGDTIILHPPGFFSVEAGPENDEGGLNSFGLAQRVSWDHIEKVVAIGPPGGPALVLGTNGDDDITIIARDASYDPLANGVQDFTVSVNTGAEVLYINTAVLLVDALAGDDDIVVREPAPNNAVWNVQLFVAGGTPASPTGDQGDVVELETPGTQSVTYTPNPAAVVIPGGLPAGMTLAATVGGIDTAILNDGTNTSIINIVPFTITLGAPFPAFTYNSSPGGAEQVVYQGLAGGDTLTINGTSADDTFTLNPTNAGSGGQRTSRGPAFDFAGATTISINGGTGGTDAVNLQATAGDDTVTATLTTVTFSAGGTVNLGAGLDQLNLVSYGGNDTFIIDNTGGLLGFAAGINFDGGDGVDALRLIGTTALTAGTYIVGPAAGQGQVVHVAGAVTQRVFFDHLEPVFDAVAGPLEVVATNAANAINYTEGFNNLANYLAGVPSPTWGEVSVDGFEAMEFIAKTTLTISALAGSDEINLNNPFTPTGLTGITVNGDDPTASDTLIVNSVPGVLDNLRHNPTSVGAGNVVNDDVAQPTVSFTGIEHLKLVVQQSDGDGVRIEGTAGNDRFLFTPTARSDSGVFTGTMDTNNATGFGPFALTETTYYNVNPAANDVDLNFFTQAGTDTLIFDGTAANDAIAVGPGGGGGADFRNTINGQVTADIEGFGLSSAVVRGYAGDDTFAHSLTLNVAVTYEGGEPSASDILNLTGPNGLAVSVTLADPTAPTNATIAGYGGLVTISGIEYVNLTAATKPLTVNGTAGEDVVAFTPTALGAGTFKASTTGAVVATSPQFSYTGVGGIGITVNGGAAGFDEVGLNATAGNDVINAVQIDATHLNFTLNAFTQPFTLAAMEGAIINGLAGDDLIRISVADLLEGAPAGSLRFTVDGGLPNASDRLVVNDDGIGDLTILRQGADQRSGSVTVGVLNPVVYVNVERLDITPIDPITGGTGSDLNGRIKVFHNDPFEYNDTRLNSAQLQRIGAYPTSPTIDPGGVAAPFQVPGDEDWYEFRPQATGTFRVRILFDLLPTLLNGRPGLPGNGDLNLDIYDANGALIVSGVPFIGAPGGKEAIFGATNDPAFAQFNRIFVRVRGATAASINLYDFDNIAGLGTGNPGVTNVDIFGPQVTDVSINHIPTAVYNLFGLKSGNAAQGPTPLVNSLIVHFQDLPARAPGFLYPALDYFMTAQEAANLFQVKGDANGIVQIAGAIITNPFPNAVGQIPTATIELIFAKPLPDDRFTLIIDDSLRDPANNRLDGESNADEPNGAPNFPSGDGNAGGDFVARFTIDSRAELGVWNSASVYIDINGNNFYDPTNLDAVNRDLTFKLGRASDFVFAGKFAPAGFGPNGYSKLAIYSVNGNVWTWRVDTNDNGLVTDPVDIQHVDPAGIIGQPVAGDFDGNPANGDEVGLFTGTMWYLDTNHNFQVNDPTDLRIPAPAGMKGYPIVGDFDGDTVVDLATWDPTTNPADNGTFFFDFGNNGYGQIDATLAGFGFIGARSRPVAADMNGDGVTDFGLFSPDRSGAVGDQLAEWYFLISDRTGVAPGTLGAFDPFFSTVPFGNDLFARFGDQFSIPVVGNFDPPVAANGTTPSVNGLSTDRGPIVGGTTVTISGTNLDGATSVLFGDVAGRIISSTPNQIVVVTPAVAAGTVSVTINSSHGNSDVGAVGQFTFLHQADVVVDFGAAGYWAFQDDASWNLIHRYNPVRSIAADFDGNGQSDLLVDFGAADGLWIRYNNSTWQRIHTYTSSRLLAGDVDGDGRAEAIIDFGQGIGTWIYTSKTNSWKLLTYVAVDGMAVGDMDGNGKADIIADLGSYGLFTYYNNANWKLVHGYNPKAILAANLDGNGTSDLVVDFGPGAGLGVWVLMNGSQWRNLHPYTSTSLNTGDLNGDGLDEVIVSFNGAAGNWVWNSSNSTWKNITNTPIQSLVTGDIDGNGRDDLVADLGALGIYIYWNDNSWKFFHSYDPDQLLMAQLDTPTAPPAAYPAAAVDQLLAAAGGSSSQYSSLAALDAYYSSWGDSTDGDSVSKIGTDRTSVLSSTRRTR